MLKEIPKATTNHKKLENRSETNFLKPKSEVVKELGFSKDQTAQFQQMADHEEGETMTDWKVFYFAGKEIMAYTLQEESADEEQNTISLLAYERQIDARQITTRIERR